MASRTLWAWFDLLSSYTRLDYFDVTLVCEDSKYNLAHKDVLAKYKKIGIEKTSDLLSKSVSDSASKKFGIKKNLNSVSKIFGIKKGSNLVSKKFGIEKSFGFGIENFWYRKKFRIRYRKNLVSEKSFGFGFVQIFGFVTHCSWVNF